MNFPAPERLNHLDAALGAALDANLGANPDTNLDADLDADPAPQPADLAHGGMRRGSVLEALHQMSTNIGSVLNQAALGQSQSSLGGG